MIHYFIFITVFVYKNCLWSDISRVNYSLAEIKFKASLAIIGYNCVYKYVCLILKHLKLVNYNCFPAYFHYFHIDFIVNFIVYFQSYTSGSILKHLINRKMITRKVFN